jgi:RNA-directed DNA polymerase
MYLFRTNEVIESKSQPVTETMVLDAYASVKKGGKGAGIDAMSFEDFDKDTRKNLYKILNRMSSGSYFPPAVKEVEIPKPDGKTRKLGIPTIGDRIAQTVVKEHLENAVDRTFAGNSYGYRKGRNAQEALRKCKENCWKYAWVIDLDIKGFFDNIDRELLMDVVKEHTSEKWVLMYTERWLKAPIVKRGGTVVNRDKGTPQGGVVSPLLANMFLDKVFDKWFKATCGEADFERYADDIVVHCRTLKDAEATLVRIIKRLSEYKLEVHPEKTKIVYCKQGYRKENYSVNSFTFLGVQYSPLLVRNRYGQMFRGYSTFVPANSFKEIGAFLRSLKIRDKTDQTIHQLAKLINGRMSGWFNYFREWGVSRVCGYFLFRLNQRLIKWAMNRHKRLTSKTKAIGYLRSEQRRNPELFVHWKHGFSF